MGTRHLTVVISNEEPKIAQYGQWDGYPDGQGADILNFLHNANIDAFKKKVNKLSFFTEEESKKEDEIGNPYDRRPYLSRDTGSKILEAVLNDKYEEGSSYSGKHKVSCVVDKLVNSIDFAADSLFCEWAYVIDLDKNTFEVYEGFNKNRLDKSERFFYLEKKSEKEYHPVRLIRTYDLNQLPTVEDFVNSFKEKDEE